MYNTPEHMRNVRNKELFFNLLFLAMGIAAAVSSFVAFITHLYP